jgi:hypothetical protein
LPVRLAEGCHEYARELEDAARDEERAEEARVCESAGECPQEEEQEDSQGANEGDFEGGALWEQGWEVVLPDAEGVDPAPAV